VIIGISGTPVSSLRVAAAPRIGMLAGHPAPGSPMVAGLALEARSLARQLVLMDPVIHTGRLDPPIDACELPPCHPGVAVFAVCKPETEQLRARVFRQATAGRDRLEPGVVAHSEQQPEGVVVAR
jgi:hypothetical protein